MPITRIAYFAQTGVITSQPSGVLGAGNDFTFTLPINSANIEVTRPIEAVTAFGQFDALNQAQTNITTCKCSLKGYLGSGSGISGLNASAINKLIGHTRTGEMNIAVGPQGFTMSGILTNLGIDISVGGFGMFDLGFAGVGHPVSLANASTSATNPISSTFGILPVTTMSIGTSGLLTGASATSVKFSYDLPTDTLTALGENPNATQGLLNSIIATKAPYKTSLSVEGFGVNPGIVDAALQSGVSVGDINIVLPKGKVTSRSFNNAAGQASATFSYSAEDVSATITAATLGAYTQNNNALTSPTWGAS
jgi:hypothetical protein